MIVRHFLQWVRTAGAAERAEATSALARAYLYSDLSNDDRMAAEGAMIMLLDDPSPLVREALAYALASSASAPPPVVLALASDQPDIAAIVLERSPLLVDTDLVDIVGGGDDWAQVAIARRSELPCAVSAALAEVGSVEACLALLENPGATIVPLSLKRMAERFGYNAPLREAMFARIDLPTGVRQSLVQMLAESLASFVARRDWLDENRARRAAQEACEKATIVIADSAGPELGLLVRHLRESGQLTAALVLRALLCGNIRLFEEALAELSDLPLARVSALIHDRRGAGRDALFRRANLPRSVLPAFHAALDAMDESGYVASPGAAAQLRRRMVERVLTACALGQSVEIAPLMTLLRRFATEAAREEARLFCNELARSEPEDLTLAAA